MKKPAYITLLIIALTSVFSCTKNDETTMILLGEEEYISDYSDVIPHFIERTDTILQTHDFYLDSVEEIMCDILGTPTMPEGYIPADVEGNYIVSPKKRIKSNYAYWPHSVTEPDFEFSFSSQHNGICGYYIDESGNQHSIDTIYVRGYRKNFTAYFIEEKTVQQQEFYAYIKRAVLVAGNICDDGIKNMCYFTVVLDASNNSEGAIGYLPKGTYFIYKDGNGLAERIL